MAENVWEYKGHTIELTANAKFRTEIGAKGFYQGTSLSAAKKAIDKELEQKAEEVKLELPVLMLVKLSGNQEKYSIRRGTITGINRETLRVQGLGDSRYGGAANVLPDSAINEKLLAEYMALENALKVLKAKIDAREVPTYLSGSAFGGKTTYADAVKKLQDGYERAKKGKSEE